MRSSKQDQIHNSIVSTLLALMDGLDARGQVRRSPAAPPPAGSAGALCPVLHPQKQLHLQRLVPGCTGKACRLREQGPPARGPAGGGDWRHQPCGRAGRRAAQARQVLTRAAAGMESPCGSCLDVAWTNAGGTSLGGLMPPLPLNSQLTDRISSMQKPVREPTCPGLPNSVTTHPAPHARQV